MNRLNRLEATSESLRTRKLVPDRQRVVKEFERTKVGSLRIEASNIRPAPVLVKTVAYLVDE